MANTGFHRISLLISRLSDICLYATDTEPMRVFFCVRCVRHVCQINSDPIPTNEKRPHIGGRFIGAFARLACDDFPLAHVIPYDSENTGRKILPRTIFL